MEKTCRLVHITYRENNRGPGREEYKVTLMPWARGCRGVWSVGENQCIYIKIFCVQMLLPGIAYFYISTHLRWIAAFSAHVTILVGNSNRYISLRECNFILVSRFDTRGSGVPGSTFLFT